MQKWEYKTVLVGWQPDNELNKLGLEGWELVAVVADVSGDAHGMSSSMTAYFKRPKK